MCDFEDGDRFLAKVNKFYILEEKRDRWIARAEEEQKTGKIAATIMANIMNHAFEELKEDLENEKINNRQAAAEKLNISVEEVNHMMKKMKTKE